MTISTKPRSDTSIPSSLISGGLQKLLDSTGRLPPVSLIITPIDGSDPISLDRFLSYNYTSSILIPVDSFSFNYAAPDLEPIYDLIKEGDIASLYANDVKISTGIIDVVDIETDEQFGEKIVFNGRDLMGQLEDQSCVSIKDEPVFSQKYTVSQTINKLIENTRIPGIRFSDSPKNGYYFGTEPNESKLSALQRYLEPLNCVAWSDPNGFLVVGRPNMSQKSKQRLFVSRQDRDSNVLSMKASRASTSIANVMLPIWTGQEDIQTKVSKEQRLMNNADGPKRLFLNNHFVQKTVVVSTPQGHSPQDLSETNQLTIAGGANLLQAYGDREIARQNQKELIVQAVVPGHYNEIGEPYKVDTVYHISFDRASIEKNMYLFQVDYSLTEQGERTSLYFCNLNTIVANLKAP